ncbi:Solute carrier family 25 member 46 [Trichinella britovi]|uniref:Solute carrier family 25 member 46 n=1 Tax=Trichinella britovi TaxID=45882 RepID=A0A0V1CM88_TRIBR|nr:Solute carrier family 25 member 46 [Trichinella britovi]
MKFYTLTVPKVPLLGCGRLSNFMIDYSYKCTPKYLSLDNAIIIISILVGSITVRNPFICLKQDYHIKKDGPLKICQVCVFSLFVTYDKIIKYCFRVTATNLGIFCKFIRSARLLGEKQNRLLPFVGNAKYVYTKVINQIKMLLFFEVNFKAAHYHRTPVTVIPIMYNVQHNQDFGSLWKGVSSSIVLRGISVASENLMSEALDYPKVIMSPNSWMIVMKHLALKAMSFAVTTPIMISAFLETVQTSLDREKPGLFDCVYEGFKRIYNDVMGPRGHPRFSVFNLTVPTVAYRLLFYVTKKVFRWHMYNSVKSHRANRSEQNKSPFDKYFPEVFTALTSDLFTEALLYPFETVLHRLYLQGTRTLIDNLDDGCSVMPIMTRYEGVIDCIRTIKLDEGIGGFYKGFGALVLQYMLHLGLVHTFRLIYEYFDRNMEAMITSESTEVDNHEVENI